MHSFNADLVALSNALPFYVILIDDKHHILFANKTMTDTLGQPLEAIFDKLCPTVVHGCEGEFSGCPLEEAVATNEAVEREVFDTRSERWFSSCIYPMDYFIPGGRRVYFHMSRDITRTKTAEEQLETSYRKLQESMNVTIEALLTTFGVRDPYTSSHQKRVTELACAIAIEMGLPQEQIEGIRIAGMVHDIGKIYIPAEILSKPARLTTEEFNMIKMHPQVAYDILKNITFPWSIAQIALQHHERIDGSGYPLGLTGDKILPEAKILAVADVVEAMVSHRPYRPALSVDASLAEMTGKAGTQFDENVVAACLRLFKEKGFVFSSDFNHKR